MARPTIPDQKQCTKCGECKKSSEFYQPTASRLSGACKACTSARDRERRFLRKNRSQEVQRRASAQTALDFHDVPPVVTKTCRLCRKVKPRTDFEQYKVRTRWGNETVRYTFTCLICVAGGPKNRRVPKTEKRCIFCKEVKPVSAFHSFNYTTRTGKNSRRLNSGCKICCAGYARQRRIESKEQIAEKNGEWRERNKLQIVERNKEYYAATKGRMREYHFKHQLKKFGITPEHHRQMVATQNGGCAICGGKPDGTKRTRLCVDHCHATGKVRGLLCHNCNVSIGLLRESPELIRALLGYVERHLK